MTLDAELLRETERQRVRSLVQGDLAGADSLHASDYQLITPLGYALSKDDYLGSIESGALDYLVFEPVTEIEVWGDDGIGLLRYQARIEFAGPDARPRSGAGTPTATSGAMVDGRPSGPRPPRSPSTADGLTGARRRSLRCGPMPVETFPIPTVEGSEVAIAAPGPGVGNWAGGPSALRVDDGFVLAYRVRRPLDSGRGVANVIARSTDGVHFETIAELHREAFDCDSLERPALVRRPDGGWRIYVRCATPGTLHWRIDAIDADDPSAFSPDRRRTVMAGDAGTAYKDPVVRRDEQGWHCGCVATTSPTAADGDRMCTEYATSRTA